MRHRLVEQVRRCRRRLLLLAFIRHAWLAITIAVTSAAALVVLLRPDAVAAGMWLAGAGAIGLAVGAVIASIVTPSLAATAAVLDKHLRLEDRVVTALQLMDDQDAVAHLVIRDASGRMATVAPAKVFPVDLRIGRRALLASGASAFAVLLVVLWTGARTDRQLSSGLGAATNGIPRSLSGAASNQAREGTARIVEDASASAPPAEARDRSFEPTTDHRPVQNLEFSPKGQPEGRPLQSETPSTEAKASTESSVSGRTGTTRSSKPPATDTPFGGPNTLAGSGESNGKTAQSSREGNARATAGGPGAAGRDGGARRDFGSGSGGVGGSPLRDVQAETGEAPTTQLSYAARYSAAWVRAQMALAQNRVPKDLRNYVRDYFAAIRPSAAE